MPTSDALPDTKLDFLGLARARFKRCAEAESGQRKAILAAKEFRAGNQWPDEVKIQRMGGQAVQGQAAQPARPCLTIDRVSAPVRQVSNSVRAANFAIDVHPNGFGADDETARILKGLLRQIQNDARGEDPIEWAADSAAEGGLGWFRLSADFCYDNPDTPPEALFDQDLKLGRIANCLTVYCDPAAQSPTKRDAKFMFVTEDMSKAEFIRQYGDKEVPSSDEWRSEGDQDTWVGDDLIRVAEYWTCDYDKVKVYLSPDGIPSFGKEPEGFSSDEDSGWKSRVIHQPNVQCAKITATKVLKKWKWPGTRIPLFPVLGEELNVDGKTVLRGVIAGAMDPQRMVNYLYSGAVEQVALSNKAPFIVAMGQVENYKTYWTNANTANFAYLPYDPVPNAPPPQRQTTEPPIQAMVEMLAKSEDAIKATTSIYDPSLGNTNPREKSGRAIMALQQQAEHANSNYLDNVQRAMVDCGDEMVMLCPTFYDRPGRVLKIVGNNEEPEQVTLGAPMPPTQQDGPQQGQPQQQPDPRAQEQAQGMQQFYDLAKGNYSVTVDVSQSYSTKRQEGLADMQDLVKVLPPEMAMVVVPNIVKYSDFPGNQDIYDMLIQALPPQLQPKQKGQPVIPPEVQAQLGQAGQMVEMLSKELNAKNQIIEQEQVKAQANLEEKKIDAATRVMVAKIQAGATIAAADIKAGIDAAKVELDQMRVVIEATQEDRLDHRGNLHESLMTGLEHAHEMRMADRQAQQEQATQQADQSHEQGMQADQHAAQADLQDQQAQSQAELQQQAADLAPEPTAE